MLVHSPPPVLHSAVMETSPQTMTEKVLDMPSAQHLMLSPPQSLRTRCSYSLKRPSSLSSLRSSPEHPP